MIKIVTSALVSALLVTGCAVGFLGGHRGESLVIVPALPLIVELDADQYYSQDGYYYSCRDNVWFYSQSQQGPWSQLPRSHYPREIRYKHHDDQGNYGHGHDDRH